MIPPNIQAALAARPAPRAGGNIAENVTGPLTSAVAGRTDHLPVSVPDDAYVIPADIVSALGQGNTAAGNKVLQGMLRELVMEHLQSGRPTVGAAPGKVDVMVAGGEFVVPPAIVAALGEGDMEAGHQVLDRFVLSVRKRTIAHLRALPGPKR